MKPKTRQELARELNISRTTLYRLLKREGIKLPSGLLYNREQKITTRTTNYISSLNVE